MAIASGWSGDGREAGSRAHGRADVFPGLGMTTGAGLVAGLIPALAIAAGSHGVSIGAILAIAGQGAALGGILGLFVGLGRGVWHPGPSSRVPDPASAREVPPPPAPAAELWDPWLDHGRDPGPEVVIDESAPAPAIEAPILERAAVRPRVISPTTGEALPLEDQIGAMLQEGTGGGVAIVGGPGSGKTTAARHLAAILPPWTLGRVRLFDDEIDLATVASAGPDPLVIIITGAARVPGIPPAVAAFMAMHCWGKHQFTPYRLAPWTQDDTIEYLLATDRDACASVMGRLKASDDLAFLDGIPELISAVLDRMARDESIGGARTALRQELADRIEAGSIRREWLEDHLVSRFRSPVATRRPVTAGGPIHESLARLTRHRPVALLTAADRLAAIIRSSARPGRNLEGHYARDLVRETARIIAGDAEAIARLADWIAGRSRGIHSLAASLLHAATPGWRPRDGTRPCLEGAYLDGAAWPGQDLAGVNLRRAELGGADLGGANLGRARLENAVLRAADLRRANLEDAHASGADLGRANLSHAWARGARLQDADLTGAVLVSADLWRAQLTRARIEGADFTGANLDDAWLNGLPLGQARFEGARFGGADLRECDLEDMVLTAPDFHDAKLQGATMTGSRMPAANFIGADLRRARLAQVDWPGACLRDADLQGASFHMGTTRSGVLDSPIACEGSRTGFYTDDDTDRYVRPAEEIRKANLRGADLRGAFIRDVDFYLVDLREARYTGDQAVHLRRCRAILDDGSA